MTPSRLAAFFAVLFVTDSTYAADVDFARDVLPILSDKCFHCHGPDEQARKEEAAIGIRRTGRRKVLVAGKSAESEL